MTDDPWDSVLRGDREKWQEYRRQLDEAHYAEDAGPVDLSGLTGPPGHPTPLGMPERIPRGAPPMRSAYIPEGRAPKDERWAYPPLIERYRVAGGSALDAEAGFPVRCIVVDNLTPQWAFVPQVDHFVPPWTVASVMICHTASQGVHLRWEAPPGVAQPAALAGTIATVTAIEREDVTTSSIGADVSSKLGSAGPSSVDVTDRAARQLGVVTQGAPGNAAWPITAYVPTNIVYTAPAGTVITGNGTSSSINTVAYSTWAVDISVTAITGGVGPTVQFYVDRQGGDGVWYQVWTSGVISTPGTASTTIGKGMAVAHDLGTAARLRWAFGGTTPPTSVTFSASVIEK